MLVVVVRGKAAVGFCWAEVDWIVAVEEESDEAEVEAGGEETAVELCYEI